MAFLLHIRMQQWEIMKSMMEKNGKQNYEVHSHYEDSSVKL